MPTNVGLVLTNDRVELISTMPRFWIQATSVTEGVKKDIGKIPIPVGHLMQPGADPDLTPEKTRHDRNLFLDLQKITNDIQISGWISPHDVVTPGSPPVWGDIEEIRTLIKSWIRSGALVRLDYRTNGNFNFGLRGNPGEAWIVEDVQFDDEDTERQAYLDQNPQLPDDWAGLRINIKLILGVLTQDWQKIS